MSTNQWISPRFVSPIKWRLKVKYDIDGWHICPSYQGNGDLYACGSFITSYPSKLYASLPQYLFGYEITSMKKMLRAKFACSSRYLRYLAVYIIGYDELLEI